MKMNENIIKGKWLEFRGEVCKAWGKITDDELDRTKGDLKAIGGLIQQPYGEAQESYSKKLKKIAEQIEQKKDAVVTQVKNDLKN